MWETLRTSKPKARKNYDCMACEWIREGEIRSGYTFSEYRAIIRARNNNWEIQKGDVYSQATCRQDGEFYTWRAIPEIEAICFKYDIMQE